MWAHSFSASGINYNVIVNTILMYPSTTGTFYPVFSSSIQNVIIVSSEAIAHWSVVLNSELYPSTWCSMSLHPTELVNPHKECLDFVASNPWWHPLLAVASPLTWWHPLLATASPPPRWHPLLAVACPPPWWHPLLATASPPPRWHALLAAASPPPWWHPLLAVASPPSRCELVNTLPGEGVTE